MNGYGLYTWAEGRMYAGVFENGVIVRVEYQPEEPTPEAPIA